jgi:hypothetical protein
MTRITISSILTSQIDVIFSELVEFYSTQGYQISEIKSPGIIIVKKRECYGPYVDNVRFCTLTINLSNFSENKILIVCSYENESVQSDIAETKAMANEVCKLQRIIKNYEE